MLNSALATKAAMITSVLDTDYLEHLGIAPDDPLLVYMTMEYPHDDDIMGGYFEASLSDGTRELRHIRTREGAQAMLDMVESGVVKAKQVQRFLLKPEDALNRLMTTSRAQLMRQHGGIGVAATKNLTWIRMQEVEEQRLYDIAVACGSTPNESVKKPPRTADKEGLWQPTAEQYWDLWSAKERKVYRDMVANLYIRGAAGNRSTKWNPPAETKAYRQAQTEKRAARVERSSGSVRKRTRKGTQSSGPQKKGKSYQSAAVVVEDSTEDSTSSSE